jgi:hypothetical protein
MPKVCNVHDAPLAIHHTGVKTMRKMSTTKRERASALITGLFVMSALFLGTKSIMASDACMSDLRAPSRGDASKTLTTPPRRISPMIEKITTPVTTDGASDSYLSKGDIEKVMKWIAVQVTTQKSPYCYKQSEGRGAGVPLSTCPEGTEKNGLLCYPECKEGFRGNGPVCWQIGCPEGFTDIGAFCQKPAPYGRGVGYVAWDEAKCKAENPQGCEQYLAMWYPKCRENFHAVGSNICSPDCPEGMNDTGTGCAKQSEGRGAGTPMECPEGLEKDGALCYEPCADGADGVGPVCWSQCPSHVPETCGAGCTTDKQTCVSKTYDQVTSVVKAVLSLASMGAGSSAGSGTLKKLSSTMDMADIIKGMADESNGFIPVRVGGQDDNFDVSKMTPIAGGYTSDIKRVEEMILHYSGMFVNDFEKLTTQEVAEMIDSKFSAGAAEQIKKEWGMRHLVYMLENNGFTAARDLLWLVSQGDPTGLASVGEAFAHQKCDSETPFPNVRELR